MLLALDDSGLEPIPWIRSPLTRSVWPTQGEKPDFGFSVTRPTNQAIDFNPEKCNIHLSTTTNKRCLQFAREFQDRLFSQLDDANLRVGGLMGTADPRFWDREYFTTAEITAMRGFVAVDLADENEDEDEDSECDGTWSERNDGDDDLEEVEV